MDYTALNTRGSDRSGTATITTKENNAQAAVNKGLSFIEEEVLT